MEEQREFPFEAVWDVQESWIAVASAFLSLGEFAFKILQWGLFVATVSVGAQRVGDTKFVYVSYSLTAVLLLMVSFRVCRELFGRFRPTHSAHPLLAVSTVIGVALVSAGISLYLILELIGIMSEFATIAERSAPVCK